jgi:probable rRNA maturation factor
MLNLTLTKEVRHRYQPKQYLVKRWVKHALIKSYKAVSIDISIVSLDRSQELNKKYLLHDYPTNVIALEYGKSHNQHTPLSGELILCDEIMVKEAILQHKDILAHYAHMIIHGMLHIQGFKHNNYKDAKIMETLEIKILQELGFDDPY